MSLGRGPLESGAWLLNKSMSAESWRRVEAKRRLGPPHGQAASNWITSTHLDTTAQIKKAEESEPELCPKNQGEKLTPELMNKINAIARRTAVKLLALCCPKKMPGHSLLTQVPGLETQYRNVEKTMKFFPLGGKEDLGSDSSDNDAASDESDDSTTKADESGGSDEEGPILGGIAVEAAPAGGEMFDPFDDFWKTKAPKEEPDPMVAVAEAAMQVKHAQDLAKGDAEALAKALSPSQALRAVLES